MYHRIEQYLSLIMNTATICNITGTFSIGCAIDLHNLSRAIWNVEYNPRRFGAAIVRIRRPKSTALIFKSGRIVVIGTNSEEMCKFSASKIVQKLSKAGIPALLKEFQIRNIVGTLDMKARLNLNDLALIHKNYISFEKELFTGLFYRIRPTIKALLFESGKIIITGAKTKSELMNASKFIYPIARQFIQRKKTLRR